MNFQESSNLKSRNAQVPRKRLAHEVTIGVHISSI